MGQSDIVSQTIDLNLCVYLSIEILYQYEYIAQVESMNYETITRYRRKGSAYRCKVTYEQEQGFNANDVTRTLVNFKNDCIVPQRYKLYIIHSDRSATSD